MYLYHSAISKFAPFARLHCPLMPRRTAPGRRPPRTDARRRDLPDSLQPLPDLSVSLHGSTKWIRVQLFVKVCAAVGASPRELSDALCQQFAPRVCRLEEDSCYMLFGGDAKKPPPGSIERAILSYKAAKCRCLCCGHMARFSSTDGEVMLCGRCMPQKIP